jgi:anti-sigma factor RsiW
VSSASHEGGDHVTDGEIAGYLDRSLSGPQRERVEDHMAVCPDCRQHLVETKELLEQVRRPRKLLIGGALAAAAAVVFVIARPDPAAIHQRDLTRGDGATVPLLAYGPMGPVNRNGLHFVWSTAPGAESYRLSVTRANGAAVWSSSGTDTVATLPDSVTLRSSERYFWVADALLGDGTTRSTKLREFGVVP